MGKHRNPRTKVSNPPSPDNLAPKDTSPPTFDAGREFGVLQEHIGLVDALSYAMQRHFERFRWSCRDGGIDDSSDDDNPLNHLNQLLCATRAAVRGVVAHGEGFARDLIKSRRAA
jgi:hypothetical protein